MVWEAQQPSSYGTGIGLKIILIWTEKFSFPSDYFFGKIYWFFWYLIFHSGRDEKAVEFDQLQTYLKIPILFLSIVHFIILFFPFLVPWNAGFPRFIFFDLQPRSLTSNQDFYLTTRLSTTNWGSHVQTSGFPCYFPLFPVIWLYWTRPLANLRTWLFANCFPDFFLNNWPSLRLYDMSHLALLLLFTHEIYYLDPRWLFYRNHCCGWSWTEIGCFYSSLTLL